MARGLRGAAMLAASRRASCVSVSVGTGGGGGGGGGVRSEAWRCTAYGGTSRARATTLRTELGIVYREGWRRTPQPVAHCDARCTEALDMPLSSQRMLAPRVVLTVAPGAAAWQ